MKRGIVILAFMLIGYYANAQLSDSLLRSAGFFLSPGVTNIYNHNIKEQPDPRFGFSVGYRIINQLKKGFFLEGGAGISIYSARYPREESHVIYTQFAPSNIYYEQQTVSQVNLTTPFLAGYKLKLGKVRLLGELGFAFNLQNVQFTKTEYSSYENVIVSTDQGMNIKFGTSFSLLARAGIRVPLTKRMSLDLLPAARYRVIYFTASDIDFRECVRADMSPWSFGLDLGLVFALDDKPAEEIYEYEYNSDTLGDFTINYQEGNKHETIKRKLVNRWPKNFIYCELAGGGLIYSNNYERTVYRQGILSVQARLGFGYLGFLYTVPLGANITLGTGRKKFEAGILATGENIIFDKFNINIVPSLAYRFENKHHFFLRLALMTHIITGGRDVDEQGMMIPGMGVSLGGCF